MSLSDLASLGGFINGIAVLISLIYLSLQIRQNTKHSRAQMQHGRAARIVDVALRLAELRGDESLAKCFDADTNVSPNDLARFLHVCRAIFVSAEDSYLQNLQGLLDDIVYESFVSSLQYGMAPGIGAAWLLTRKMYEPNFRDFMDRTIGDAPGRKLAERGLPAWKNAVEQLRGAA